MAHRILSRAKLPQVHPTTEAAQILGLHQQSQRTFFKLLTIGLTVRKMSEMFAAQPYTYRP